VLDNGSSWGPTHQKLNSKEAVRYIDADHTEKDLQQAQTKNSLLEDDVVEEQH